MDMESWVRARTDVYLRHGAKKHRRRVVQRLISILSDIKKHEPAVRAPGNVGRGQVHRYYARNQHLAARTLGDHYRSIELLWSLLDRAGKPPRPNSLNVQSP